MPTATALCRRFAAFLICAASTQGSYSDDFAWHDVARWPCYTSKSRARELAKGEPLCMRHAAGRLRQCQGSSQPRSGRVGAVGKLTPVQTHTKNMRNMFVARLRTYADCHCLCRRLAAFSFLLQQAPREVPLKDFARHDTVR